MGLLNPYMSNAPTEHSPNSYYKAKKTEYKSNVLKAHICYNNFSN